MKRFLVVALRAIDIFILPLVFLAALCFKFVRNAGVHRLPFSKSILIRVGVFPVADHYYEPQFRFDHQDAVMPERQLTGINWNISGQLDFLRGFIYSEELKAIPQKKEDGVEFYMGNPAFGWGDAEYWYQLIRLVKPKKIIEIGSGFSTLVAIMAIEKNRDENSGYVCDHTCIEPYEMPWLEKKNVKVIRKKVEDMNLDFFSDLGSGDILFIDSSHMVRPSGDVNFEFLTLLPTLKSGVYVHIHDIFSPRDYPDQWIKEEVRFWNEQYILEAFLTNNSDWEIIGALNFLYKDHRENFNNISPFCLDGCNPGSFYIRRR